METQRWLTDAWNRIYNVLLWSNLVHGIIIYHGQNFLLTRASTHPQRLDYPIQGCLWQPHCVLTLLTL